VAYHWFFCSRALGQVARAKLAPAMKQAPLTVAALHGNQTITERAHLSHAVLRELLQRGRQEEIHAATLG
jgi:hypothetical protein